MAVCVVGVWPIPHHLLPSINDRNDFPCPDETSILPCTCDFTTDSLLILACSGVTSEELNNVFSQSFPILNFDEFQLDNSDFPTLPAGFSNGVNFKHMNFVSNNIVTVVDQAFSDSYGTLQSFVMVSKPSADTLAWPLPNLGSFTQLTDIFIQGPYGDFDGPLVSNSLTSAAFNLNYMTSLTTLNTLTGTPNLITLKFDETSLASIVPDIFIGLTHLESLTITGSDLTSLEARSLKLDTHKLTTLDLSGNMIDTIHPEAIQFPARLIGLPPQVKLARNQLTKLDETVFLPLLSIPAKVNVEDNPLECGCDLLWLTDEAVSEEFNRLLGLPESCHLDGTGYDQDTILDFIEYQCSNGGTK
ncbi:hypothetical protein Pmani_035862 [Petrolisthes manimaculis]|uniref:Oplophorus-luciferin 2-monooxygenase non-catalytic subunit n=1 Tax=Petrolisthes manimaculis TaxID=1843537 RepID=A0AAE1NJX4_9EUCA|nr:hypothetical protein Pmani_035862 [Petrolisthes manimaculis]